MLHHRHTADTVCVIGLGYVGLPLAVALAARGRRVIGVERNREVGEELRHKRAHVHEAGLELAEAVDSGMLTVTESLPDGTGVGTYVVCVGTPVDEAGSPDLSQLEGALAALAGLVDDGDLIVLRSTVPVGTSRRLLAALRTHRDVDLAFCPERTVQGAAVRELRTLPQIVAGSSPQAVERAAALFRLLTPEIVEVSSLEAAEIAKLACNSFRYTAFAFANELARLCEKVGVSTREVQQAASTGYRRGAMPAPGPAGGSCLPKDIRILSRAFDDYGLGPSGLVDGVGEAHRAVPDRLAVDVMEHTAKVADFGQLEVALLGVAFKGHPETDDERCSPSVDLLERIRRRADAVTIRSHDPLVPHRRQRALGYLPCAEVAEAVQGANVVILGTNHRIYRNLSLPWLTSRMEHPGLVYDIWSLHADQVPEVPDEVMYLAFGEGQLK
ncbi:nucleotide sugar dehydrogenase [Kitasatospora sp. NPDC057542]|uniref:nucleotide sugar dehydrogenase n=1 Tax=Streptomycetaceae TaxID=2062 RepID=UPI001CCAEE5E|nr:nucleotide sugar dehydrogenase [Streptomyces sp. LS1784]